MAEFRFIGQYTGDRDSINASGVVFEGREPSKVDAADAIRRLRNNPEFEEVGKRDPLDHDGDGKKGGSDSAAEAAKAEITALRAEYKQKLGKNPFSGWGADDLRRRIAEA